MSAGPGTCRPEVPPRKTPGDTNSKKMDTQDLAWNCSLQSCQSTTLNCFSVGLPACSRLQQVSDVWAISRSDLDSSKHAVFEGFTNQNAAKNQKLILKKSSHIFYGLLRWTNDFGEAGMNNQLKISIWKKYFDCKLVKLDIQGKINIFTMISSIFLAKPASPNLQVQLREPKTI